jgi:hypothetical protein
MFVAMASSVSALGAQWSLEPSAEGRLSYTDNIALTPNTTDKVWGYQLAPKAVFAWREALTEVAGEGRLGLNRYPTRGELDTTDYLAQVRMSTTSERNGYGLNAAFNRDSTLGTEARQTGVVQIRRQRNQVSLTPSFRRSLTERSSASLLYQFNDVSYESGSGLRDYTDHQLVAGYSWAGSDRLNWDTSLSWDKLRTHDNSIRTDTKSISLGASYAWSERIKLGLSAGWRYTETEIVSNTLICPLGPQLLCDFFLVPRVLVTQDFTTKGRGLLLNGEAEVKFNSGRVTLAVSRNVNPTGSGLTVRTDRVGGQWQRDLTERLSTSVSAAWLRSAYDGNLGASAKYITLEPTLSWKLRERLTLGASYSYVWTRTDNTAGSSRSNTLYLTLSYEWPPVSLR